MNVIDAFVVTLGLDRSNYKKEREAQRAENRQFKEELKQGASETDASDRKLNNEQAKRDRRRIDDQKKIKDSLDATKKQAVETFAVLVGANSLKDYISNTVTAASATQRMAKAAGVGVQDLSAFGDMIRRNGGDANTAKASIANLAAAMEMWNTLGIVSPEMNAAFTQIGANPADSPIEVYKKFAAWAETHNPRLVALTGAMLGFDEASIDMAMKGRKAVEENITESKRLGALNDEQAKKLRALQQQWEHATQAVKGNALALLVDAAPALSGFLAWVDQGVTKFPTFTKLVLALGTALTGWGGVKIGAGLLRLLGLGGGGAAAAEGGGALATGAGAVGALPAAGLAALVGTIVYAVHPTTANKGEDEAMARINNGRLGANGRRQAAYNYFRSQGWSEDEAKGIVAGITAENGSLDPTAKNPTSSAYGLGQWLTPRQNDFKKWSGGLSVQDSSFEQQLAFINWELNNTEKRAGDRIRGKNAHAAADAYLRHNMRPGDGLEGDLRRANKALASMSINTGPVTVNTQATDAKGIARDMKGELTRTGYTAQANSGVM